MKTQKIIILLSILCSCIQLANAQNIFDLVHQKISEDEMHEKLSLERLNADIDYLINTIEEVHINPYLNVSKDQFFKKYKEIKNQITEPLTRKEFYRLITPLLSIMMDSHTAIWFPKEMKNYYDKNNGKYIPFDVEISNGKIFIKHNYSKLKIIPSAEIMSINNIPSNEIVKQIKEHCFGFTNYSIQKQAEDDFKKLLWIAYDFEGPFNIKFKDEERKVLGLTKAKLDSLKKHTHNKINKKEQKIYEKIDESIGLLTIKSFYGFDEKKFDEMLGQEFSKIKEDRISNLIIDVRDNKGGNSMLAQRLGCYI